ncbi:hypothetical protein Salat_2100500 [Sesamum alatum]|uniref:RNase H type-1 domain-containing protein n=1 Tax=Sesamum alatum TaxID=300844 RepID=A0AAE1Y1I6_9LAMI|nr:hypothetical protein Salat_2100500 [Sesamum alatum]
MAMEGEFRAPVQVVDFASRYLSSFLTQAGGFAIHWSLGIPSRWQVPPPIYVKLNFDGATLMGGVQVGVGVVARDELGRCVAWLSRRVERTGDGELAESLAAREAVLLALQKCWPRVIVEGDYAVLIQKLQQKKRDLSTYDPIVADILSFSSCIPSCQFSLVRRSGNTVAHFFAHYCNDFAEGEHLIPTVVVSLVSSDIAK